MMLSHALMLPIAVAAPLMFAADDYPLTLESTDRARSGAFLDHLSCRHPGLRRHWPAQCRALNPQDKASVSCDFAGPDRRYLYVCSSDKVFRRPVLASERFSPSR
jgi:hypothetical protein